MTSSPSTSPSRASPSARKRQSLIVPRGGDRRQVLGPQQRQQRAAVDDRQAALAELHVGAGQAGDLV